jgi:hypothetical protein
MYKKKKALFRVAFKGYFLLFTLHFPPVLFFFFFFGLNSASGLGTVAIHHSSETVDHSPSFSAHFFVFSPCVLFCSYLGCSALSAPLFSTPSQVLPLASPLLLLYSFPCIPSGAPIRLLLHHTQASFSALCPPVPFQAWHYTCQYPSSARTAPISWAVSESGLAYNVGGECSEAAT